MIRGPRVYTVAVAVAASLCGCIAIADFGDYDTTRAADEAGAPEAGAALSIASVAPVAVHRGKSVTFAVTVDRGGERAPLNVEMSSLPAGVTVPRVVLPAGAGTGTATLTMATTSEVALGDFTAVVRASAIAGASSASSASSATSIVMVGVRTTQLDPTFGEGGFVIGPVNETVEDFACAADGTIFVAAAGLQDNNPRLAGRFLIHRLAATGAVDTFLDRAGNAGDHRLGISPRGELVMTSALTSSAKVEGYSLTSRELVWSTALDPLTATAIARPAIATDGTIFVVSSGVSSGGRGVVYVRRLSAQGTDPSVGAGAIRLPQSASSSNELGAGAATAGGFVVCTSRTVAASGTSEVVIRRITEDGGIDEAFGDGGELTVPSTNGFVISCVDVAVDGARLIASANISVLRSSESRALLVAVGSDGRLDPSFGTAGVAERAPPGSLARAIAVAGGDGGAIYMTGADPSGAFVFASRADGTPDPSFGAGDAGVIAINIGSSTTTQAVYVLADGRIMVQGVIELGIGSTWFVARYLP